MHGAAALSPAFFGVEIACSVLVRHCAMLLQRMYVLFRSESGGLNLPADLFIQRY